MRRLLVLVSVIVLVDVMFYSAITPLLPSYVDDLDLTKSEAGVLSGSYAAGTMAASLPAGWLAARWGVRPTLLTGLALLAVSSVAFGFGESFELLTVRSELGYFPANVPPVAVGFPEFLRANLTVTLTPEPSTFALGAAGLIALGAGTVGRRKRREARDTV